MSRICHSYRPLMVLESFHCYLKLYIGKVYFRDAMDFLFFTGDERCRRELVIVFKVGSAELKQERRGHRLSETKRPSRCTGRRGRNRRRERQI